MFIRNGPKVTIGGASLRFRHTQIRVLIAIHAWLVSFQLQDPDQLFRGIARTLIPRKEDSRPRSCPRQNYIEHWPHMMPKNVESICSTLVYKSPPHRWRKVFLRLIPALTGTEEMVISSASTVQEPFMTKRSQLIFDSSPSGTGLD